MPAKPYDATTKQIVEIDPQDWLELLGFPRLPVALVDADLAAVTTDADRILKVLESPQRLFHFEFESGRDVRRLPERLLRYNSLIRYSFELPVATVVFLLNSRAGGLSEVNGSYTQTHPDIGEYSAFRYRVIRVWELPVQAILSGGRATLPLALLSDLGQMSPAQVVGQMQQRLAAPAAEPAAEAQTLWGAAFIMAGLRFSETEVESLFRGVLNMEESSTYQAILTRGHNQGLTQGLTQGITQGITQGLSQGRLSEARRILLLVAEDRLGNPSPAVMTTLDTISSPERIEALIKRVPVVETWDELMAE